MPRSSPTHDCFSFARNNNQWIREDFDKKPDLLRHRHRRTRLYLSGHAKWQ